MRATNVRVAGAFLLTLAAACGGQPQSQRTPPPDAQRVDASKAGRISGRVTIDGPVPENTKVDTGGSDVCARENPGGLLVENFVVENGGLDNVFVYVKSGLDHYYFDTPGEAVKLDQRGCRYVPHVFGAQVGQPIEISNSDPTMHNVAAVAETNRGFNFSQAIKGLKNTVSFTAPEVGIHLKCDVHAWMSAYAGILEHPYFAVTSGGGNFELKNVPAGTYTIEAWHEKLGRRSHSLTLRENGAEQVSFTVQAGSES